MAYDEVNTMPAKGKQENVLDKSILQDTIKGKVELIQSDRYAAWLATLKDKQAKLRIDAKLLQLQKHGWPYGDYKAVGRGVFELRFHFGPGYRVYVSPEGNSQLILLLVGGDKSSQQKDVAIAQQLAQDWRKENGNKVDKLGSCE